LEDVIVLVTLIERWRLALTLVTAPLAAYTTL